MFQDSDDDDESTVVGEPFGIHSPHSPSHIDDTVTASGKQYSCLFTKFMAGQMHNIYLGQQS